MMRTLLLLAGILSLLPWPYACGHGAARARTDLHGDPLPENAVARLGSLYRMHDGKISFMAFSADSNKLAVLTESMDLFSDDDQRHLLWLWDLRSEMLLWRVTFPHPFVAGPAWSPDGRFLVVADEHTVHFLNSATGRPIRQIDKPNHSIMCLALSPDGKLLAFGGVSSESDAVVIWDVSTGKERKCLEGQPAAAQELLFSADGKRLLAWSASERIPENARPPATCRSICIWDLPSGKLHHPRWCKNGYVLCARDGKSLGFWSDNNTFHLWNMDADRETGRLTKVTEPVVFLPGDRVVVARDTLHRLGTWDLATGRRLQLLKEDPYQRFHEKEIGGFSAITAVSPDGRWLAWAENYGSLNGHGVRLWDLKRGSEKLPDTGHRGLVTCLAFAADGKTLVSGSADQSVRVWEIGKQRELQVYAEHRQGITAVVISPDGKLIASGDTNNAVHLWNRASGKAVWRRTAQPGGKDFRPTGIHYLVFSPDGSSLLVGSAKECAPGEEGQVVRLDTLTGKPLECRIETNRVPLACSVNGTLLASSGEEKEGSVTNGTLYLHKSVAGRLFRRIPFREERLGNLCLSPDGATVLTQSHFRVMGGISFVWVPPKYRLWEAATGKKILELNQPDICGDAGTFLDVLTFSSDGRLLVVPLSDWSGRLSVIDARTGKSIGKLDGHRAALKCCVFSPDGRYLASTGSDQTIVIWKAPVAPRPRSPDLSPRALQAIWKDLAGEDAARAYQGIGALADNPGKSIPFMADHMQPAPPAPSREIEQHLRQLDSDRYAERAAAQAALEKLDEMAEPALRDALSRQPSLEMRRRIERLLARSEREATRGKRLRLLRAVVVLERAGTDEARHLLQKLAGGRKDATLTQQAQAALRRLDRRTQR